MRVFLVFIFILFNSLLVFGAPISGTVEKVGQGEGNVVVDSVTGSPISNAKISIPHKNVTVFTDSQGRFTLDVEINNPTILSVEKDGYRPFSITIDAKAMEKPIVIGVEKSNPRNLLLEHNLFHIGDDSFSSNSANAGDFKQKSVGPFYSKNFKLKILTPGEQAVLVIGSIIGIDTQMAMQVGQSKVKSAYASPPEVFFNGTKIAEIQINGDNQEIKIPSNLLRANYDNELTIKSGRNLFQRAYIDYDDIEIMNLFVDVR